ncbi:MAG: hypothetical protein ACJ72Z_10430, partial [Pyrinomonadaceae bacterium]
NFNTARTFDHVPIRNYPVDGCKKPGTARKAVTAVVKRFDRDSGGLNALDELRQKILRGKIAR